MNRILLYYPTINIPDSNWLRRSLFYSDQVASIVPFRDLRDPNISDELRLLMDEGQFKPIFIHNIFKQFDFTENGEILGRTFVQILESEDYKKLTAKNASKNIDLAIPGFHIYISKFSNDLYKYLLGRKLINIVDNDKVSIEKYAGLIYMSLLAQHAADIDEDLVIPSTDLPAYEGIAFMFTKNEKPSLRFELSNCLPTPSKQVTLKEIIAFKSKRKDELIRFRQIISQTEHKLSHASDSRESKEILVEFGENLQLGLVDLQKALKDSRFEVTFSSLSSLMDFKGPGIIGALATIGVTIVNPFIGLGLGAIKLAGTMVSSLIKTRKNASSSSYSYLFHGKKEGIIK